MKTERDLFEIEAREYEDCDLSKNEDGSYENDLTHTCFYWWCKSVSREGYKLVPIEPTKEMLNSQDYIRDESATEIYKAMIEAA